MSCVEPAKPVLGKFAGALSIMEEDASPSRAAKVQYLTFISFSFICFLNLIRKTCGDYATAINYWWRSSPPCDRRTQAAGYTGTPAPARETFRWCRFGLSN